MTLFFKWIFPALWFGILALVSWQILHTGEVSSVRKFAAEAIAMALLGFLLFRFLDWPLADAVYDGGDHLLIRRGGVEESVPLSSIKEVLDWTFFRPPRITLRFDTPGKFGPKIAFLPATGVTLSPFAASSVADDLIKRVRASRSG
jgi:hypothetical protein